MLVHDGAEMGGKGAAEPGPGSVQVQLRWVFMQRKVLTSTQEIVSLVSFFVGRFYLPTQSWKLCVSFS